MKHLLHLSTVLVLNRNWQAIHVKTPAEAFCMMASGSATGLDVQGDDHIMPVSWEVWLTLPVREDDNQVSHCVFDGAHCHGDDDLWRCKRQPRFRRFSGLGCHF